MIEATIAAVLVWVLILALPFLEETVPQDSLHAEGCHRVPPESRVVT